MDGSTNNDCNDETGECTCKTYNIIGDKCDSCMEGYYKYPDCKGIFFLRFEKKFVMANHGFCIKSHFMCEQFLFIVDVQFS